MREWYARNTNEHGWSRTVLANQIMSQLHRRAGAAPSNFADVLPAGDSELMQQLTKDPYNLEFLKLTTPVAERHLERALVAQVERFLLGSSEPGPRSSDARWRIRPRRRRVLHRLADVPHPRPADTWSWS